MARSPLALAALATTAIPGLDVVATRAPQRTTGDFQTTGVVDADGRHWVVRCPLSPAAGAAMEAEVALLANLAGAADRARLPFDVPRPAGFAELPEGGRAMVYPELPGRPLDLELLTAGPGLSAELARAIAALHELPLRVVEDAGLPVYDADSYRTRCLAEVDEAARTGHVPPALLNRWEHALEDVALWRFRATPVHGDLAPDNVLVDGARVQAVLNFTSAHVGDPAEDLAWLMASAPLDSLDSLEEAYNLARTESPDSTLLDRAVLVSELAVARWLLHGVRSDDEGVVVDATHMLRTLAEQVADEPAIGHRDPVVTPWGDNEDEPGQGDVTGTDGGPDIEQEPLAGTEADQTGAAQELDAAAGDELPGTAEVASVQFSPASETDVSRSAPSADTTDADAGIDAVAAEGTTDDERGQQTEEIEIPEDLRAEGSTDAKNGDDVRRAQGR